MLYARSGAPLIAILAWLLGFAVHTNAQDAASTAAPASVAAPLRDLSSAIEFLRATSAGHSPERGEVTLDEIGTAESNAEIAGVKFHYPFNRYLSLLVTDVTTVGRIKFSDVMNQLVKQSKDRGGDPLLTSKMLFQQWWDTENVGPGLTLGPHCDDEGAPVANPDPLQPTTSKLNNFLYGCPREEGKEEVDDKNDPFAAEAANGEAAYSAIAFVNRFDLLSRPRKYRDNDNLVVYPDCGEYRIIFARNSGKSDPVDPHSAIRRNLIIFEARIPNPRPEPQLANPDRAPRGCIPILRFWYSLSDPDLKADERGDLLKKFFIEGDLTRVGEPRIPAVVDIDNYSFQGGQIRTNQFMNVFIKGSPPSPYVPGTSDTFKPGDWTLREFRTVFANGLLLIVPDSVKSTPGSDLFKQTTKDIRVPALTQDIRLQIGNLLGQVSGGKKGIDDVNSIAFKTSGRGINAFESDESKQNLGDIIAAYGDDNNKRQDPFAKRIAETLSAIGSKISAVNVVDRIRTQTCAGCHQFSDSRDDKSFPNRPPDLRKGFDTVGLGGKAKWPNKACGDIDMKVCKSPKDNPTDKQSHPPMPFVHISERTDDLRDSISDKPKGQRYAISLTAECLLDFRERFIERALSIAETSSNHCPQ